MVDMVVTKMFGPPPNDIIDSSTTRPFPPPNNNASARHIRVHQIIYRRRRQRGNFGSQHGCGRRHGGSNTRVTENRFCSHDGSIHELFTIANGIAIAVAILNDVANSVADSNSVVTVKVQ